MRCSNYNLLENEKELPKQLKYIFFKLVMIIKILQFKEPQTTEKSCLTNFFVKHPTEAGKKYAEIQEYFTAKKIIY